MGLSIPEIPSHPVDSEHARHVEAGHDLVGIRKNVPLLIGDHRSHDADLEQGREGLCDFGQDIARRCWKVSMRAVLVDTGEAQLEIPSRKRPRKSVGVVDLGTALILWRVATQRRPAGEPRIDSKSAANWTAYGAGPGR